jgi:glutaredoxin
VETKLVLYNRESCPDCRLVREKLSELELTYLCVNVSPVKESRKKLFELTGQYSVPVLFDGDKMLTSHDNILEYLIETFAKRAVRPVQY